MTLGSTLLKGMEFSSPLIINAGGTLKDWDNLPALLETSLQIILFGAMLLPIREGSLGGISATLFVQEQGGIKTSYNRMGLPEKYGDQWYEQNLVNKNQLVADYGKVLAINIAGFNTGQLASCAEICRDAGVRIIFVDISCSNTDQEPICFSPEATKNALVAVKNAAPDAVIGVKLPYIPLSSLLGELVEVCKEMQIDVIEVINAMGQYYPTNASEHGVFRLAGPASGAGFLAKDPAQGMVTRVKSLLGDNSLIRIMATGG
ncbi:hypothetical protein IIC44_02580, partial [Patescibacteria group bacterium]|nr:hypothetical protein [Patescibacteria group bacterium]